MGEKREVVKKMSLSYEGFFDLNNTYTVLKKKLKELGYEGKETSYDVKVFPEGKEISIELEIAKKAADYMKLSLEIVLSFSKVKEKNIKIDKKTIKVEEGSISFELTGFLLSDYENKWTNSPLSYLWRSFVDAFIYKGYLKSYEQDIKNDAEAIYSEISSLLNIMQYRYNK